ncbi:MAG: protein translocase subunit SecF [Coriobacteriales bacterium]|jgi:SecD/SecF fusion protein|nr:protein translocase subunit SecF [Coriobacteriales bacterium]
MVRPFKKDIDFLSKRRIFFIVSLVLMVISLIALPLRGLNFGIEFVGGTSIAFSNTGEITTEQMRSAVEAAGGETPIVQSTSDAGGSNGFIVRVAITDAAEASKLGDEVVSALSLSDNSAEVTTIGAAWGDEVTRTSLIAFAVALALIIIYIAIRFEYKMGVVAVIALLHDLLIIIGVYAVFGREVTPNVIAALLTIMGYSLYDTVVVFHRINDNVATTAHHSFITVANHSINQVFIRTFNTTLTSLVPVVAMLFFGGETLKDFAFAMTIGLVLGAYSSIGIASPLYALWKQREPKYKKLYEKYGEGVGTFTTAENLQD